jgi:hypothetical protein
MDGESTGRWLLRDIVRDQGIPARSTGTTTGLRPASSPTTRTRRPATI